MSSPSTQRSIAAEAGDAQNRNRFLLDKLDRAVLTPIQMMSFWAAVSLPFLHVPLLATGLETPDMRAAFLLLLALNVVALLVGYPHKR